MARLGDAVGVCAELSRRALARDIACNMDICSAVQCESAAVATVRRWDCRVALYTNSQDFSTGGNEITPYVSGNTSQSMHPGVSSVVGINLELLESSRRKRCWIHGMPIHTPIRKSSALQCDYTSLASVSAYINPYISPNNVWFPCELGYAVDKVLAEA